MQTNLPLSPARLWDSLMEMAKIGGTAKGGSNRQTLTDLDAHGRRMLQAWGEAAGLTLTTDRMGTMLLTRPGRDPARKAVAIGSHLDTQPTGGKFDGVLGVLAGLEVMRALQEAGVETEAPIVLVNWTNEEGARFSPPMMASGVAMGLLDEAAMLATTDTADAVFGEELRRIGWQGEADPAALREFGAYFELHIEQGTVLEREGLSIGVVTHALCQEWLDVTVTGTESHAGASMQGRRDALVPAAMLVAAVEAIALAHGGRGTVGRLTLSPDSRNITPSEVRLTVDLRADDAETLGRMVTALRERAAELTSSRGVEIAVENFWTSPLVPFDPVLTARVRDAAAARGLPHRDMAAGIGHDAVYVARRLPAALIFTPCVGGISHNEAEAITPEWAAAGVQVLADAVLATAGVVR
ncbi:Zn-dependent hydrolase [Roseomonas sp. NAR14]|uniref:Zn-dependent hydrolase n=1 Tax=Roseomonas acroporae TaxID=2937791 RepID=A0A9X1Y9E5_9PROT|nr:Zn-dependent hydrolase [Roseomonas acroporae]MCK8786324.1 Zn-dependent hydrolase [Roseomonas acroporae]